MQRRIRKVVERGSDSTCWISDDCFTAMREYMLKQLEIFRRKHPQAHPGERACVWAENATISVILRYKEDHRILVHLGVDEAAEFYRMMASTI